MLDRRALGIGSHHDTYVFPMSHSLVHERYTDHALDASTPTTREAASWCTESGVVWGSFWGMQRQSRTLVPSK